MEKNHLTGEKLWSPNCEGELCLLYTGLERLFLHHAICVTKEGIFWPKSGANGNFWNFIIFLVISPSFFGRFILNLSALFLLRDRSAPWPWPRPSLLSDFFRICLLCSCQSLGRTVAAGAMASNFIRVHHGIS